MAPVFDASSSGATAAGTSITFSHTCSGSDRFLIVMAACRDVGVNLTTVTYNGVAMTQIGATMTTGASIESEMWGLLNPDSGAHDVVVSASASGRLVGASASYTGVDQTVPLGTETDEEDGSISVASNVGELVVGGAGWQCSDGTIGNCAWSVLDERVERRSGTSANDAGVSIGDTAGQATNTTVAWTPTATTGAQFTHGVALKPAAAGGAAPVRTQKVTSGSTLLVGKVG